MTDLAADSGLIEKCWKYLVLGIIQGLTEFLPISSTAHLKVVPMMMGWKDPGISVAAVIQLGSIFAVFAYFRHEVQTILKGISQGFRHGQWQEPNTRLGLGILMGTIPIVIAGMSIKIFWPGFEESPIRSVLSIGIISILMAILLGIGEVLGRRVKPLENITGKDGFIIGLGQALALMPGTSRSGITFTSALLNGFKRQDAARFSFLLGIPSITLAGIVELKNTININSFTDCLPILIGIISSAAISWLAIDWFLKYLQTNTSMAFVTYRFAFGIVLIVWSTIFSPN